MIPALFHCNPRVHFGNLGKNTVTGPGNSVLDASLVKSTRIKERITLDLRLEVFNVLNHANFGLPER